MSWSSLLDPAAPGLGCAVPLAGGVSLEPLRQAQSEVLAAAMAAMDPWTSLGLGPDALARYWQRPDPGAARLALLHHGALSGGFCVRPRWLRGPFLELMCVLPVAQGQGVGRLVIDWLADESRVLGPNLWTSAMAENLPAIAFYRALGFREAARIADLMAPGRTEVLLRRETRAASHARDNR